MQLKPRIIIPALLSLILCQFLNGQGIRIASGEHIRVPSGNTLAIDGNLYIESGGLMINNGKVSLPGNLVNQNIGPTNLGTGNFIFNGTGPQEIQGLSIFENFSLNNAAGLSLSSDITVNGILGLTTGHLRLGDYNLLLGQSSSVSGSPSSSAMVVATGTGYFRKGFSGPGTFKFEVGDNDGTPEYSPVELTFESGTFGSNNYAGVNLRNTKYPNPEFQNNYIKRYWTIKTDNISGFIADIDCQYDPADVVGSESNMYCLKVAPPPITAYGPANISEHYLPADGLTSFSDFTGAGAPCFTMGATASVVSNVGCYGGSDGVVTVSTSGGTSPYSYSWSTNPAQTGQSATGLTSGLYNVTVTDALSCTVTSSATITQPPQWWPGLTGPSPVCLQSSGNTYQTASGMSNYLWVVSAGGTVTGGGSASDNFVTITWNTTGLKSVSVNYTTPAGCIAVEPSIKSVTVNPLPAPIISGTDHVTNHQTVTYSTPFVDGHSYSWSVNSGYVANCNPENNCITVTWILPCGGIDPYVSVTESIQFTGCSKTVTKSITIIP